MISTDRRAVKTLLPIDKCTSISSKNSNFYCKLPLIQKFAVSNAVFSSHEPKAHDELTVYQSICRLCVSVLTFSNMNISATSGPIATKFYLKHHKGRGKAAICFLPNRIGTLVSMATNISHRVIMGKT